MRPYDGHHKKLIRQLWIERGIFSAVILFIVISNLWTPLMGRRGVVLVDGHEVAVLKSPRAAQSLVDDILSRSSPGFEGKTEFVQDVTVAAERRRPESVMSATVAEKKLSDATAVGAKLWVIAVNGHPIVALDTQKAAGEALALYVKANSGEEVGPEAAPSRFAEEVVVKQIMTPLDRYSKTPQDACERLSSGEKKRVYHVVKEGEVAYTIAHKYDMGYFRLKELNPGMNLDRLSVGDKLIISDSQPALTVISTRRASLTETIDCPVRVVKSSSLYKGQEVVKQGGRMGTRRIDAILTLANGAVIEREILESHTEHEAVAQIVAVGTRSRPVGRRFRGDTYMASSHSSGGSFSGGEGAARRIYLMYRHGNNHGRFRGVYGMSQLGVNVGTAHSLDHAFGVHYAEGLSWSQILRYLDNGDRSFGGRWGCAGGPHNPHAAASWIRSHITK